MIEYLERICIYENPKPHVHSRHGFFPGVVKLASGELLALFAIGEAFESPDSATYVSRSSDGGATWRLQGPLSGGPPGAVVTSDYLKATLLGGGRLLAMGYRFYRDDPEQGIGIPETGGILRGDNVVSVSGDQGRTWSAPRAIPRSRPELIEISGPALELRSGELLAAGPLYRMPDGSNPSGQIGVLLRSQDGGTTWDDRAQFFAAEGGNITPFETRLSQMTDGRVVALVWAYDTANDRQYPNHYVVSHDDGRSWSKPASTGHLGQAAGLLAVEENLLLSIHAHRAGEVGLFVRVVDFRGDLWRCREEHVIYGAGQRAQTAQGQQMTEMFTALRFGQPSLVHLAGSEFLAVHWAIEDGQGRILAHRLRVTI